MDGPPIADSLSELRLSHSEAHVLSLKADSNRRSGRTDGAPVTPRDSLKPAGVHYVVMLIYDMPARCTGAMPTSQDTCVSRAIPQFVHLSIWSLSARPAPALSVAISP